MNEREDDQAVPGAGGAPEPPAPPPPPQGVVPTLTIESEAPVRRGGIGGRLVAGVVGGLVLVGGVGFAAAQLGSGSDRTPEQAVEELFDAIGDEDVLGVLATLDPGERDVLTSRVERFFGELERLEVLDDSFELSGVSGVDLEFSDLTFRTEQVRDDLVRVYVTGGTASYAVNTDELPVGDFLADTFDRFGVEYRGHQDSDSDTMTPEQADDTFLVAHEGSDGWRVSIGYTAVEAARAQMGTPAPAAGAGLTAIGADSPEAAVEGFLQAATALDVEGMVARLSPNELRALHDYWPVLVPQGSLDGFTDQLDAELELVDLQLRSDADGDRAQVFIDSIGLDVTADGETGGGTIADGCITLRGIAQEALVELGVDDPSAPLCQDDLQDLAAEAMEEMGGFGMGVLDPGAFALDPDAEVATIGIATEQVDGRWFVAPIGTFADAGLAVLEVIDRDDLDAAVDAFESFFGEGFFGGGMVGGGFVPPGMSGEEIVEEFEAIGEPLELDDDFESGSGGVLPGTLYPLSSEQQALLEEFVLGAVGDDLDAATCVLDELDAFASSEQLLELVDAYELEFEPSQPTQDLFFTALETCGP